MKPKIIGSKLIFGAYYSIYFSCFTFSIIMAQSGQIRSHILHAIHGLPCPGSTTGAPKTPSSVDQPMVLTGHFSIQRPHPLHNPGNR